MDQIRFACVCASNVNRSMEGHRILKKNKYNVSSYGTNELIKIPGPNGSSHSFDFGTTYREILDQLSSYDNPFYSDHGLIELMKKDDGTKPKAERFTATFNAASLAFFDVIFTYEKPIMLKVLNEFQENGNRTFQICHVINIQTVDNISEAVVSGGHTLNLAKEILKNHKKLTENIENIVEDFNHTSGNILSFHIVTY